MEFNEIWTKEKNDQMRQMIKEDKSVDEIINFFGKDVLKHHPKKKYYHDDSNIKLPGINKINGEYTINLKEFRKFEKIIEKINKNI